MEIAKQSSKALSKALKILKKGGVVICPTDTVYGFLANASNKKAIKKIYKIKKRSRQKPLPVFVKDITTAKKLTEIDGKQEKILKKYWPGKYTFILKRKSGVKIYTTVKKIPIAKRSRILDEVGTIALRIPKHAFLQSLLRKINRPLVQTSVNVSKKEPLRDSKDIINIFGKNKLVDLLIDAEKLKKSKPSKIIDLTGKILTKIR